MPTFGLDLVRSVLAFFHCLIIILLHPPVSQDDINTIAQGIKRQTNDGALKRFNPYLGPEPAIFVLLILGEAKSTLAVPAPSASE